MKKCKCTFIVNARNPLAPSVAEITRAKIIFCPLHAAAPELLDLLKYGLDAYTRLQGNARAQAFDKFVEDGYAAIAKAEGK